MSASQVYGSFAKWYITNLKAKPYLINVGSGLVLMSTGDVLAQKVEIGGVAGDERQQQSEQLKQRQRIEKEAHQQQQQQLELQQQQQQKQRHNDGTGISFQLLRDTTTGGVDTVYQNLRHEIASWDKFRTAKMGAWSLVFTPFYVGVYKMYDRYLPKRTPASIAARVGLSFLCSIPINFSFYTYGNFVQHTADWYTEKRQQQVQVQVIKGQDSAKVQETPYRFDQLVEKTQRKLEAELFSTIKTSATFWIPINFLSFSVVPAQFQPLSLMFFSVFWNCYLSMSQHREVVVPSSSVTSQQESIETTTISKIGGTQE